VALPDPSEFYWQVIKKPDFRVDKFSILFEKRRIDDKNI